MYSLLYRAHKFGEMVIRPVSFDFKFNGKRLVFRSQTSSNLDSRAVDTQFMLGKALLVCPILTPETYSVECILKGASL